MNIAEQPNARRTTAGIALIVSIVCWALAPVFIRFLKDAYDPFTQAFVRYASASVALVAISWVRFRAEFRWILRHSTPLVGMACLNVFQQSMWTAGCYGSTATMAQLTTKLTVVFVILLSFFLFREERAVITHPLYVFGTMLSFGGVACVLAKNPGSLVPVFDGAAMLLLLVAFCWAIYTVWAKHLVAGMHPVPMFTVLALYTTLGLGMVSCLFGHPATILEAGPRITGIVFVSGLLPIATAHPAFHFAQRRLGSAFSTSCNLFTPFVTYLFAILILADERLTPFQWVGAVVLITGTSLVTFAGQRAQGRS